MNEIDRINILEFLAWNDKNGCYLDKEVVAIGQEVFTLKEAKLMFWDVLFRDKIIEYVQYDNALELNYDETYQYLINNNLSEVANEFIEAFCKKEKLKIYNEIIDYI